MDAVAFLKLLLDPGRLAVVGAIAMRELGAAELARATDRPERDVMAVLGPLVQAGLVTETRSTPTAAPRYRVDAQALRALAAELPHPPPADQRIAYGMTAEEGRILGRFFQGTKLTELPSARSKRQVVVERLALEFEPGRRYPEKEVNEVLGRFHDDHASLRRALVDEGLLTRRMGVYVRSGGRA